MIKIILGIVVFIYFFIFRQFRVYNYDAFNKTVSEKETKKQIVFNRTHLISTYFFFLIIIVLILSPELLEFVDKYTNLNVGEIVSISGVLASVMVAYLIYYQQNLEGIRTEITIKKLLKEKYDENNKNLNSHIPNTNIQKNENEQKFSIPVFSSRNMDYKIESIIKNVSEKELNDENVPYYSSDLSIAKTLLPSLPTYNHVYPNNEIEVDVTDINGNAFTAIANDECVYICIVFLMFKDVPLQISCDVVRS
ncbi:hypothetical protein [Chengkuizengella axinellae]|uniref:Uncharacterized protein n=1 Tax=Chengkuizengella axinellae TaxID=3064388 RepID=A0ABT9J512_9BACL|nr:hypothetical protein [Chengkuizengella sp. 2205SS18-9]MDP5276709.1 hypothetical protein [Chengkuizengella sp. 2205SS18-9]